MKLSMVFKRIRRKGKRQREMKRGEEMDIQKTIEELLNESAATWWEWDISHNRVSFHPRKVEMLGYEMEGFRGVGFEAFTEIIHPDDYERAMEAMRAFLRGDVSIYRVDYRIRRKDGTYTWFIDRGHAVERTAEGKPKLLRGFVFDLGRDLEKGALDEKLVEQVREAFRGSEAFGAKRRGEKVKESTAGGGGGGEGKRPAVVCSGCKRMKISHDEWISVSEEISLVYSGELSHGICDDCMKALYPEFYEKVG